MVCIDDEIPFEIPLTWAWVRLNFVSIIARGSSPRPIKEYLTDSLDGINWIKIGDTEKDGMYINSTKEKITVEGLSKSRLVHKGDFLLTNSMSFGRPYITNVDGCIHDGWLVISPIGTSFKQKFLYYLLSSGYAFSQFAGKVSGAVVKNLNSDKVAGAMFPLPPYNEQQRILDKLDVLVPKINTYGIMSDAIYDMNTSLRSKLRKSILQEAIQGKLVSQDPNDEPASVLLQRIKEEKQRLVKDEKLKKKDIVDSIIYKGDDNKYYEQVGNKITCIEEEIPFKIPKEWCWVRLSDIVLINPKNHVPDNTMAAFIPMERIDATFLSSYSYVERKWGEIKQGFTHFSDGDVAFAKITPCFQNRKSMILNNLPNGIGAGTTELKVLRPYRNTLSIGYLLFFLESPYFVEEAIFKGTANQQRIMSGYMESKLFPLPPLEEQKRISKKIWEAYKQMIL